MKASFMGLSTRATAITGIPDAPPVYTHLYTHWRAFQAESYRIMRNRCSDSGLKSETLIYRDVSARAPVKTVRRKSYTGSNPVPTTVSRTLFIG